MKMSLTFWGASSRAAFAVGGGEGGTGGRRVAGPAPGRPWRAVRWKAGACPGSAHVSLGFDLVMQARGILQFVFLEIID